MTRDDESFLGRWSRLKKQARAEEGPPAPKPDAPATARVSGVPPSAPVPPGVAAPASAVSRSTEAPALPSLESLKGLASEYTEFLKPGVDENLRRSALKKLFSDPYFETYDRFEAYCEDYTKGEPIPLAMLKTLEHAKGLLFDEEKTQPGAEKPAAEKPEAKPSEIVVSRGPADAAVEPKAEAPVPAPEPEAKS